MMPIKAFITTAMIMCFSISTAQAGFGRTSSYGFGGSNTPSGTTSSPQADSDGDGVPDSQDTFPNDASESLDTDNDGIGNVADLDPLNPQVSRDSQPPEFQSAPATLALNT